MQYDLSEFEDTTYGTPICFLPNSDSTLTLYYGSSFTSINAQAEGVIMSNSLFPVGSISSTTEPVSHCIDLADLKHDTWTEFVFPLSSFLIILVALAMIYHIIIKRLLP